MGWMGRWMGRWWDRGGEGRVWIRRGRAECVGAEGEHRRAAEIKAKV